MPPRCSICAHAGRTAIETAIAGGASLRSIAHQYGTTHTALARHRDHCGALALIDARQKADEPRQSQVRSEMDLLLSRIRKLIDACDRYLQDPDDPDRYDLSPRAHEVDVIYIDGDAIRKAKLSTLLKLVQRETGLITSGGEYKVADPRKLILATAAQLTRQLELLAKLTGELKDAQQVNILVMPDWLGLRDRLLDALTPYPDALEAVIDALG